MVGTGELLLRIWDEEEEELSAAELREVWEWEEWMFRRGSRSGSTCERGRGDMPSPSKELIPRMN